MDAKQGDSHSGPRPGTSSPAPSDAYLVFEIEGRRHALSVGAVLEVLPALAVDPIPGRDGTLLGLITVRGQSLPVVDLRRHLGFEARPIRVEDHFLVARIRGRTLVLPCDRVLDVTMLAQHEDAETGALVRAGGRVETILRDDDGLVFVPDLRGCLALARAA